MSSESRPQTRPTRAWYLVPFLLSIIGGIIGYFAVKDEDKRMANRLLVLSIVVFVLETSATIAVPAVTVFSFVGSPVTTSLQSTAASPEPLFMDRYTFPVGGPLTVTLRNMGSVSQNLQNADYYVNGILASATPSGCTAGSTASALAPGGSCVIIVSVPLTSLFPEAAYPFKVVTPTGEVFLSSVFYGPSG
jgi:hypothetical protein